MLHFKISVIVDLLLCPLCIVVLTHYKLIQYTATLLNIFFDKIKSTSYYINNYCYLTVGHLIINFQTVSETWKMMTKKAEVQC